MSLASEIATRAVQAPQQHIRSVDPSRIAEAGLRAGHDYKMEHIRNEYLEDRQRTMEHLRHMLNRESDTRTRLMNLHEQGYGSGPLLGPGATAMDRQYALAASHRGIDQSAQRHSRNRMATEASRTLATPFDGDKVAAALAEAHAPDAAVGAWMKAQPGSVQAQYGYGPGGFGSTAHADAARHVYLASPEGISARNSIDQAMGRAMEEHAAR